MSWIFPIGRHTILLPQTWQVLHIRSPSLTPSSTSLICTYHTPWILPLSLVVSLWQLSSVLPLTISVSLLLRLSSHPTPLLSSLPPLTTKIWSAPLNANSLQTRMWSIPCELWERDFEGHTGSGRDPLIPIFQVQHTQELTHTDVCKSVHSNMLRTNTLTVSSVRMNSDTNMNTCMYAHPLPLFFPIGHRRMELMTQPGATLSPTIDCFTRYVRTWCSYTLTECLLGNHLLYTVSSQFCWCSFISIPLFYIPYCLFNNPNNSLLCIFCVFSSFFSFIFPPLE